MFESLFVHFQTVVHCFGEPRSIVIPSTVREIGEEAFARISFIEDLSFEEGLVRIGAGAFSSCYGFMSLAFPASLEVIGKRAFVCCVSLRRITFAVGSRLRCIGRDAFAFSLSYKVVLPASVTEIDPTAFGYNIWENATWDGQQFSFAAKGSLLSADSRILLHSFLGDRPVEIPAQTEVIGRRAFRLRRLPSISFENGTRLREIAEKALNWNHSPFRHRLRQSVIDALRIASLWQQSVLKSGDSSNESGHEHFSIAA
jgi:hypothetical protein